MSVASLEAELHELRMTITELDVMADWIRSVRKKVRSKADRFSAVSVSGAWGGAAAREFEAELKRAKTQVQDAADRANSALAVIDEEKSTTKVKIAVKEAELAAARIWEAAQAALRKAGQS